MSVCLFLFFGCFFPPFFEIFPRIFLLSFFFPFVAVFLRRDFFFGVVEGRGRMRLRLTGGGKKGSEGRGREGKEG